MSQTLKWILFDAVATRMGVSALLRCRSTRIGARLLRRSPQLHAHVHPFLLLFRTIPFKGIKGRNGMLFDMVWTKANFVGNEVVVDVNGFDPKKSYVCEYVKNKVVVFPWFCHRLHHTH